MYLCIYVCMYVCMYACMYVCMSINMYGPKYPKTVSISETKATSRAVLADRELHGPPEILKEPLLNEIPQLVIDGRKLEICPRW